MLNLVHLIFLKTLIFSVMDWRFELNTGSIFTVHNTEDGTHNESETSVHSWNLDVSKKLKDNIIKP